MIIFRQNTAAAAATNNPILHAGEPGFTTDDGVFKIGDGVTEWNDLPIINATVSPNVQTDDYTLVLSDQSRLVLTNKGSANTVTVPANADVPFPVGTRIEIFQLGAGQTTISGDTGVTVLSTGDKISAQYGSAYLTKTATDAWKMTGDLTT